MLSIAHAATGAIIATHVQNPLLSIPLILASHYALDAIYHHDAGTGLSSGVKTRKTALFLGLLDLFIAGVIVLILYPNAINFTTLQINNWTPIWGAFVGLLPDFLESPRNFLKYEPRWLKPLNRFHGSFHHSTPNILAGIAPQIILLTLIWMYR